MKEKEAFMISISKEAQYTKHRKRRANRFSIRSVSTAYPCIYTYLNSIGDLCKIMNVFHTKIDLKTVSLEETIF